MLIFFFEKKKKNKKTSINLSFSLTAIIAIHALQDALCAQLLHALVDIDAHHAEAVAVCGLAAKAKNGKADTLERIGSARGVHQPLVEGARVVRGLSLKEW